VRKDAVNSHVSLAPRIPTFVFASKQELVCRKIAGQVNSCRQNKKKEDDGNQKNNLCPTSYHRKTLYIASRWAYFF
jgi:hypothetical protein